MATIGAIPSPPPLWADEVFECSSIVLLKITLIRKPVNGSQFVYLNGLYMTLGLGYDYTMTDNEITFNNNVLTDDGHVTVKYSY